MAIGHLLAKTGSFYFVTSYRRHEAFSSKRKVQWWAIYFAKVTKLLI